MSRFCTCFRKNSLFFFAATTFAATVPLIARAFASAIVAAYAANEHFLSCIRLICRYLSIMVISTRRFLARPASVELSATGTSAPMPFVKTWYLSRTFLRIR